MTVKKLLLATLLATAACGLTTACFAQAYYGEPFGYRDRYDWRGPYTRPDYLRGGPGPRVQAGAGMGIGAVR